MKARKKGSDDEWKDVAYVQLRDSYCLTSADQMEFQYDHLFTEIKSYDQVDEEEYWQDVRERAAIAAVQAGINQTTNGQFFDALYGKNKDITYYYKDIAKFSVACANALIEELKE